LSGAAFRARLDALNAGRRPEGRRWIYAAYDQLTLDIGPLSEQPPGETGLVVIECPDKAGRRPYHRQKLTLILANLRHFALEAAARGIMVLHVVARGGYSDGVRWAAGKVGPLEMMEAAERELRAELRPVIEAGLLRVLPHVGWLSTVDDFVEATGGLAKTPWKMEPFYQHLRKKTGLLMAGGKPVGGRFNFDADNRRPWRPERGDPPAPTPPVFAPDAITEEVRDLVETHFARHPGQVDLAALPATAADAERLWGFARADCLPQFGPFEDAMHTASSGLFHTRISPLLNLHRLLPARVVHEAAGLDIPLASKEGFIRQVLGWREYVRHIHAATDGFRALPGSPTPPALPAPGDGGYAAWLAHTGSPTRWKPGPAEGGGDGGACPSALDAHAPVPPAFWGAPSGLRCLDTVVADVWREGWSHHITRLMVLSNLGTLLGLSPRALTDWFWVAYIDAFDWVVEPNVLGMGTYGVGGLMTTKPYVSGGAYIDRMSNYCKGCAFDPKRNCPVTNLYWDFMARHEAMLRRNHRTSGALAGLSRRTPEQRAHDAAVADAVRDTLSKGRVLR
jgi:deoxyribodipyrimidine photolyase-related protein